MVLVAPKDKPRDQLAGTVYCLECEDCHKCYIGKSARPLGKRIKEHITTRSSSTSAVSEHLKTAKHHFDPDKVKILAWEPKDFSRKILEAIHIRKEKTALNRDKGLDLDPVHTTIVQTHMNPSDFYRQVKIDSLIFIAKAWNTLVSRLFSALARILDMIRFDMKILWCSKLFNDCSWLKIEGHVKLCYIVDSSVKTLLLRYFFLNNSDLEWAGHWILLLFISKARIKIRQWPAELHTPQRPIMTSLFRGGGTQIWVGYGSPAQSFNHYPITKPEKTKICNPSSESFISWRAFF